MFTIVHWHLIVQQVHILYRKKLLSLQQQLYVRISKIYVILFSLYNFCFLKIFKISASIFKLNLLSTPFQVKSNSTNYSTYVQLTRDFSLEFRNKSMYQSLKEVSEKLYFHILQTIVTGILVKMQICSGPSPVLLNQLLWEQRQHIKVGETLLTLSQN
jgi:hypothetical protein